MFNIKNDDYDVALNGFKTYDPNDLSTKRGCYYLNAPITFIADITMYKKGTHFPAGDEFIPFQMIGIKSDHEVPLEEREYPMFGDVGMDFAESVIKRFDLSCSQFAIENPYKPNLVRALSDENLYMFHDMEFTYEMRKFTSVKVLNKRIKKYMDRGYKLIGMTTGSHILKFDNARLMDIRDYRASRSLPELCTSTESESMTNDEELGDMDATNIITKRGIEYDEIEAVEPSG